MPPFAPTAELAPGTLVGGRFRVRAPRAAGGASTVYLAVDEQLGSAAALKVVQTGWADLTAVRPRFEREAGLSLRLGARLGAAGRAQGTHKGLPYLALDFIDGPTLRERLAAQGPLAPREALAVTRRLLGRLSVLHAEGLAHLDLKPAHVMAGGATLLDLGSALPLGAPREAVGISPAYAAPEGWGEEAAADPRGDVYAAGILLFEMVSGRRPFRLDREAPLSSLARRPPPDHELLGACGSGALAAVVGRALDPDPAARFGDAEALLAALEAVGEGPEAP